MSAQAAPSHAPFASEALVLRVEDDGVIVRLVREGAEARARVAAQGASLGEGDRVLVIAGEGTHYVVGVLHGARREVRTATGATATVEGDAVVLRDASGARVLTYASDTGRVTLEAPEGDLQLAAPKGRVLIDAGVAVELRSERLRAEVGEAAWRVGRWELRARRLAEKVDQAVRDVDGLLLTRVERARTLAREAFDVVAGRTRVTSREDTVVDGKRVLLG